MAVIVIYWDPLFSSTASIQWDAVDVHYSCQKYLSDELRAGRLPFWTPYVFSGMPFLADPQVGAWYPLNWPFLLIGITPRSIELEIALHCFIAATGAFFLCLSILGSRWAGVFCGLFYALSGFFAGHSSHVGIFQAAAILPWLLWAGLRAARSPIWLPAAALAAGCIVLVGHFQSALYAFCALALLLATEFAMHRYPARNFIMIVVGVLVSAAVLSAVMTLPGLELTAQSERAASNYAQSANAVLVPGALLTLVNPNHYHAPDVTNYTGPQDITQFYFYQGLLLLPLVLIGLATSRWRWYGLALILPAVWYSLGPPGGFYSVVALLPGLRNVRSPVHDWFIVALGLAILAASGISVLRKRVSSPWIACGLLAVVGGDLWYWNMDHNRLAYARESFDTLYGQREENFVDVAAASKALSPMARLWAPSDSPAFGPLNGALDTRIEVTYGYNPLELSRYSRYLQSAVSNPRLLDSLSVTSKLDVAKGRFVSNADSLFRLSVPFSTVSAATPEESGRLIQTIDPSKVAVVEGMSATLRNGSAQLTLTRYEGDLYGVHYHTEQPTLVRLAIPYFPGWRAEIDGKESRLLAVDHALTGVLLTPGEHDLIVRYRSKWFLLGAFLSGSSWLLVLFWLERSLVQLGFISKQIQRLRRSPNHEQLYS